MLTIVKSLAGTEKEYLKGKVVNKVLYVEVDGELQKLGKVSYFPECENFPVRMRRREFPKVNFQSTTDYLEKYRDYGSAQEIHCPKLWELLEELEKEHKETLC